MSPCTSHRPPAARNRAWCDCHGRAAGTGVPGGQQQVRDHRFALTGGRARGQRALPHRRRDGLGAPDPCAARCVLHPDLTTPRLPAAPPAGRHPPPTTPTPPRPALRPPRSWHRTTPVPPPRTASPRPGCRSPFRPRVSHPITRGIDRLDTPVTPEPPVLLPRRFLPPYGLGLPPPRCLSSGRIASALPCAWDRDS
jgi:hypothetical protein